MLVMTLHWSYRGHRRRWCRCWWWSCWPASHYCSKFKCKANNWSSCKPSAQTGALNILHLSARRSVLARQTASQLDGDTLSLARRTDYRLRRVGWLAGWLAGRTAKLVAHSVWVRRASRFDRELSCTVYDPGAEHQMSSIHHHQLGH